MKVNISNLVSISEANQNFSRVARLVNENGVAVILKNNVPRYVLIEYSQLGKVESTEDEEIEKVAKRLFLNIKKPLKHCRNEQAYQSPNHKNAQAAYLRDRGKCI